MILSIPVSETMGTGMGTMTWVRVRVRVLHVKSHGYRGLKPGPWVQVQTSVSG